MQKDTRPGQSDTPPGSAAVCCKNCSHHYNGNFCPRCGQSAKDFDKPLRFFFVDFAGNIFAFDTRLWQSLKDILFCPGKMEANYISGKRIRYMPPFRLYVFVSFIFFLVLSWSTRNNISKNRSELQILAGKAIADSVLREVGAKHPEVNRALNSCKGSDGEIQALATPADSSNVAADSLSGFSNRAPSYSAGKMNHVIENPEMYVSRFFKHASWSLFLLMPFYGFLLWLNFRKSKRYYISHFLLSINHHVLVFSILLLVLVVGMLFPSKNIYPENYLLYLFPVYAWVGAVRLYQRHWLKTGIRLFVVIFCYLFVSALVTAFIVWLSFT